MEERFAYYGRGEYHTAVCSRHGRALSNDRFLFEKIATHGHVMIRHDCVMAKGFYDMVVPYDNFLIILVIFLVL